MASTWSLHTARQPSMYRKWNEVSIYRLSRETCTGDYFNTSFMSRVKIALGPIAVASCSHEKSVNFAGSTRTKGGAMQGFRVTKAIWNSDTRIEALPRKIGGRVGPAEDISDGGSDDAVPFDNLYLRQPFVPGQAPHCSTVRGLSTLDTVTISPRM